MIKKTKPAPLSLPYKIAIMVLAAELAGALGSAFTFSAIGTWYASLNKPAFTPPSWVFGPVWTLLYLLMGAAAALVWHEGNKSGRKRNDGKAQYRYALKLYGIQLFLNVLWSILFFGMRSPLYALIEIVLLWIAIALTMKAFYRISRNAAYLLLPYIAWVSFAAVLNLSVWMLNAA